MQSCMYFVCGFNGFSQFTSLICKENAAPSKNGASMPPAGTEKFVVCLLSPTEIHHFPKHLLCSWSTVVTSESDGDRAEVYGFTEDQEFSSQQEHCVFDSEADDLKSLENGVRLEYPDCPRGFSYHSLCHGRSNVESFYVVTFNGVFKAKKTINRDQDKCVKQTVHLSRFVIPYQSLVTSLSCGKEHVLLLLSDGHVYSQGSGSRGQLGVGSLENKSEATLVEALQPLPCLIVAAGGWHSLALTSTGDVYSWGWNQSGQLGIGCSDINCDVDSDGDSFLTEQKPCLTQESCKRLMFSVLPLLIDFKGDVEKISCGTRHSAAITVDKTLWTWGWNGYGQLGHGDKADKHCPTPVESLSSSNYQLTDVLCNAWNTLISARIIS